MKLIDILVKELPKRGGWPKRANCITQDCDLRVEPAYCHPSVAKCDDDGFWFLESSRIGGFEVDTLASDYTTAIITREQYEAALAEKEHPLPWDDKKKPCPTLGAECRGCPDCGRRVSCTSDDITDDAVRAEMGMNSRPLDAALAAKNDGWIEWGGGDCPLDHGLIIDAKDRDGYIHYGEVVGKSLYIDDIFWNRGVCALEDNEIIAYRLHQPQEVEQEEADDEADLNECIGHTPAPVWNGEGVMPPVGCVCERSWCGDGWQPCKILFASNQIVVVKLKESDREDAYNIGDVTFRHIRSESERKRDEAIEEMIKIATMYTTKSLGLDLAFNSIYNSIAAGEIPGVKLED